MAVNGTRRRRWSVASAVLVTLAAWALAPAPLLACPSCYTGKVARAAVFGPDLLRNLGLLVLPFVILAGLAAVLHRIGANR